LEGVPQRPVSWERQPQAGGADSTAEVPSPLVGRSQVVEHPHSDLVSAPRPDPVALDAGVDDLAAREGIEQRGGSGPK
jgi:hypothetical protein